MTYEEWLAGGLPVGRADRADLHAGEPGHDRGAPGSVAGTGGDHLEA